MKRLKGMDKVLAQVLSKKQIKLKHKHGTPAKFAAACYAAVPGLISMDEAAIAVHKYNREWALAGILTITLTGKCKGCGFTISPDSTFCGECLCEGDSL